MMISTMSKTNEIKKEKKRNAYSYLSSVGISLCCLLLSSCSTYSSKFSCADSRGLPCEMLRSVDRQIDSGEIDKVYKAQCKGSRCKTKAMQAEAVRPQNGPIKAKATLPDELEDVIITHDSEMNAMPTE